MVLAERITCHPTVLVRTVHQHHDGVIVEDAGVMLHLSFRLQKDLEVRDKRRLDLLQGYVRHVIMMAQEISDVLIDGLVFCQRSF